MPALERYAKSSAEAVVGLASAARLVTAGDQGDAFRMPVAPAYAFVLDVSAAATAAGDTLDVFVQTMLDFGPAEGNWLDVVAFTQVLGNGGTKRHIGKIEATEAESMFEAGAALSAGSVRNLAGDKWRARWVITETSSASFTFSLHGIPM